MALWTEINPAELTAFSRVAQDTLDQGPLVDVLPNVYQDQVKFTWTVNAILSESAEYGELDTEAPIGTGPAGEEKTMRLLPVSRKLRLSEYEQVSDPDRARALAEERADAVVRFVINRLNRARAEALVAGGLEINENKIVQSVDFGRAGDQTGVTPGTAWGASGATPVEDLRAWADRIADASGVEPDRLIVSTRVMSALAGVMGADGPAASRQEVSDTLVSYGLPAPTVFDGRVAGERLIEDDTLILAASGGQSGGTVFAPTVEARDPRYNLEAGEEPGIIAAVYSEDDPPVKWVLGKAIAMPVLSNPDTTLSAEVL